MAEARLPLWMFESGSAPRVCVMLGTPAQGEPIDTETAYPRGEQDALGFGRGRLRESVRCASASDRWAKESGRVCAFTGRVGLPALGPPTTTPAAPIRVAWRDSQPETHNLTEGSARPRRQTPEPSAGLCAFLR